MTKFIVHIEDGKCGSSSIQKSLFEARKDLREAGILYETAVPGNGQFSLVSLLGKNTRGAADAVAEQTRQTLEMIHGNLRRDDTVLLSGESFFSVPPGQMWKILQEIAPRIERLDVIAYVRSPHSMYLSLVQQMLKASSVYVKPDAYLRRLDRVLSAWVDFSGADSLTVRYFDRAHLVDGDAVADFSQVLGALAGVADLKLPRSDENKSLSAEQMVVLQKFRARFLGDMDGKYSPLSSHLIRFFEAMNGAAAVGHKPRLSNAARSVILINNAEVFSNLKHQFPEAGIEEIVPQEKTVDCAMPWTASDGVQEILQDCDPELVDRFCELLPGFDLGLKDGMSMKAERAVRDILRRPDVKRDLMIPAMQQYWKKSGCGAAARQLDDLCKP